MFGSNSSKNKDSPASQDKGDIKNISSSDTLNNSDKFKKFENEGVLFKAKLIGSELVMEPRGDKMCQNSIQRLKAIVKGTKSHKRRINLKISYEGVKVFDEKTDELLHHHEVSQISYIAGDETDSRTFGYVSDVPNKAHQFICFKASGPAINVMSVISSLFEAVLERKNQGEKGKHQHQISMESVTKVPRQDSVDLIGDSGIMDGDSSMISGNSATGTCLFDDLFSTSNASNEFTVNHIPMRKPAPRPIPKRQNSATSGGIFHPPASLPRPAPTFQSSLSSSTQGHNRSLVYNHSSVSLSDAALTRSFNLPNPSLSAHQSNSQARSQSVSSVSNEDRYAVFNDIDNLPSIFESTLLGSVNNIDKPIISNTGNTPSDMAIKMASSSGGALTTNGNVFRQTNPFDDDFFA